jgi:hypothetical protein
LSTFKGGKRNISKKDKKVKARKKAPSDEVLYEALLKAYNAKTPPAPCISSEVAKAAGITDLELGRAAVRAAMKRLMAAGKVEGVEPSGGRAAVLYKPKEG